MDWFKKSMIESTRRCCFSDISSRGKDEDRAQASKQLSTSSPFTSSYTAMFFCAISGEAPQDPVVSSKSGQVYERRLILKYINENGTDPITGEKLEEADLIAVKASTLAFLYLDADVALLTFVQTRKPLRLGRRRCLPSLRCCTRSRTNGTRSSSRPSRSSSSTTRRARSSATPSMLRTPRCASSPDSSRSVILPESACRRVDVATGALQADTSFLPERLPACRLPWGWRRRLPLATWT